MMKTDVEMTKRANENPEEFDRYFKSLPIEPQITYRVTPFASSSGRLAFGFTDEDAALTIQIKEEGGPGEINLVVDGYFAGLIHQLIAQQSNSFRKRSLRTS